MQRAAGAGGEAGTVEEDAGAVDDLGLAGAVLLLGPVVLVAGGAADGVVLPLVLAELLDGLLDALPVVLLGEVRAERAAAVVGPAGVDALAAAAEDARPAARQPRQVAAVALVRVGGVGELDPDAGEVQRCFSHRLTLCRRHRDRARRGPDGRGCWVARVRRRCRMPKRRQRLAQYGGAGRPGRLRCAGRGSAPWARPCGPTSFRPDQRTAGTTRGGRHGPVPARQPRPRRSARRPPAPEGVCAQAPRRGLALVRRGTILTVLQPIA